MAQQHADHRVQFRPAMTYRTIWVNLLVLFFLAATVTVIILNRQQVKLNEVERIQQQFEVGTILLQLSENTMHLHQLLLHQPQETLLLTPAIVAEWERISQSIEEHLIVLLAGREAVAIPLLPTAEVDRYRTSWQQVDQILRANTTQQLLTPIMRELAAPLREMEQANAALLRALQTTINREQVLSVERARVYRTLFFCVMILFLALVVWTLHVFRQFTQNHQAMAAELQVSERRHRALLDTIPDIVLRRTRDGYYTDFKPAVAFGRFMPSSDFIGKHVSEILSPEIAAASIEAANRALETGEMQRYEYRMANRLTGIMTDYEARVTPSGEDEVQVIVRDITEEKLRNEQQHQAQKLESLGVLAGGIAHDFNNLLTGMIAQMSLAKMKLSRDRSPVEQIDKALTAAERAADLTRQLLTYAGKAPVQVTMLDLNGLIRDNLGLLETALPNGAELQLALAETLPMIEADRGHIQQIIMNLALNAAEALRQSTLHPEPSAATAPIEKRYVSIATAVSVLSAGAKEQRSRGNHLQPGNYVVLRVQDNGIGMDESTLQRIFDPFFSTKEHGHGLGLSATLGIVHSYGGALHVESTWGSGTTFTLFFPPIAQAAVHRADEGGASTTAAYTELSTVLVIDDESSIREVVVDVLEPLGFTVYQAVSGAEGIAQVEQHQGVVDLVLLDIKMPGLSGSETLRQLLNVQPSLKVIISSGFSKSELCAKLHDATVVGYLPKPYTAAQLLNSVYQALAG